MQAPGSVAIGSRHYLFPSDQDPEARHSQGSNISDAFPYLVESHIESGQTFESEEPSIDHVGIMTGAEAIRDGWRKSQAPHLRQQLDSPRYDGSVSPQIDMVSHRAGGGTAGGISPLSYNPRDIKQRTLSPSEFDEPPSEPREYLEPQISGNREDSALAHGELPPAKPESTIGPWDSASQRSNLASSSMYPLPRGMTMPLASENDNRHLRNKPSYAGGLSYIDEEGAYYRSEATRPASTLGGLDVKGHAEEEHEMKGLMRDAEGMGGLDVGYEDQVKGQYGLYEDPARSTPLSPTGHRGQAYSTLMFALGLDRLLALFGRDVGRLPLEQAIDRKRRGMGGQRWPVATYVLTAGSSASKHPSPTKLITVAVMTALMIYELVRNNQLTGSPISTSPTFNYMIGPTPEVLINIGARFPPSAATCQELGPTS